ncbi:MAG: RNA polymerase sigma factor region1.1 domain-containing protein, partial [Candidatus Liptonbacteria bacterium]|nr:RNA polymerase sigma factor region1.1 domain-containing protein [Candidatus Liptonbacteria bacterium]
MKKTRNRSNAARRGRSGGENKRRRLENALRRRAHERARRLAGYGEALREIIAKGRPRGFVTDSEILTAFPRIEKDVAFLDEVYDALENAGIKVV